MNKQNSLVYVRGIANLIPSSHRIGHYVLAAVLDTPVLRPVNVQEPVNTEFSSRRGVSNLFPGMGELNVLPQISDEFVMVFELQVKDVCKVSVSLTHGQVFTVYSWGPLGGRDSKIIHSSHGDERGRDQKKHSLDELKFMGKGKQGLREVDENEEVKSNDYHHYEGVEHIIKGEEIVRLRNQLVSLTSLFQFWGSLCFISSASNEISCFHQS